MQTKNLKRKGFTLVELVIVVAVIAVLSAILIPTIGCFVEQAKETNDMATVRLLNVALVEDGAEHSAPKTMSEVVKVMEEKGYGIEKLTPRSSGDILWDSVNNRFLLRREKDSENLYYDNSKTLSENHLLWRVAKNQADIKSGYSNYLKDGGTFDAYQPITTGLDVGKHIGIDVTYTGEKYALIRTNGGKLTVDAPNAHVEHYNIANEVDLQAVSDSTYVEHGIVGKMTVAAAAKNVVIKATAVVTEITNSSANLNLETGAGVNTVTGTEPKTGAASGKSEAIKVSSYEQLQGLALASTAGVKLNKIELINDIDISGKSWQPFGFDEQHPFEGTIDGKGHTIKGLGPNGYNSTAIIVNTTNQNKGVAYGFVSVAKNATIKNVNFTDVNINIENGIAIGAVVGDARGNSLTIENVTVSGAVKGKDKVGGLVGLAGYDENKSSDFQLTINNCTNNASVTAVCNENYNRAGGIVGALGGDANFRGKTVIITNCTNNGAVTSIGALNSQSYSGPAIRAGGLVGQNNGSGGKTFNIEGSVNTGKITAKNTATSTTLELGENENKNEDLKLFVAVYKFGDRVEKNAA